MYMYIYIYDSYIDPKVFACFQGMLDSAICWGVQQLPGNCRSTHPPAF